MIAKRVQNAASIRYKIINYVTETCKTRDFATVHVIEICKAANISKVTFFKYFDKKEDLLLLYKSIINYSICTEASLHDLHSRRGLEAVVDRFAQFSRETPSLARELISTLLHSMPPILPVKLNEADKQFFFPNVNFDHVSILPFWDLIEGFMLEGILNKEISRSSNASDLTDMFIASLYGAIVTSHIKHHDQQVVFFNNVMKGFIRSL